MIKIKGLVEPKVSGRYRTRCGEVADITVVEIITRYPNREEISRQVTGTVKGQFHERRWHESGLYTLNIFPLVLPSNINISMPDPNDGNTYDLVEYLGSGLKTAYYLVPASTLTVGKVEISFEKGNEMFYKDKFTIGEQPEGAVLIPGSERFGPSDE